MEKNLKQRNLEKKKKYITKDGEEIEIEEEPSEEIGEKPKKKKPKKEYKFVDENGEEV